MVIGFFIKICYNFLSNCKLLKEDVSQLTEFWSRSGFRRRRSWPISRFCSLEIVGKALVSQVEPVRLEYKSGTSGVSFVCAVNRTPHQRRFHYLLTILCISPPSSAEVKNAWSLTFTPQYVIITWYLVKHGDNFKQRWAGLYPASYGWWWWWWWWCCCCCCSPREKVKSLCLTKYHAMNAY
jgi:hypothetical protein